MMSPMSRCWFRLAEALTCSFLSYLWQGSPSTKLSRISRRKISMLKVGVRVAFVEDPLLPGEFGLSSRTSTIHEGPSLMVDFVDWTLVNVSSWLECVTGVWLNLRVLSSTHLIIYISTPEFHSYHTAVMLLSDVHVALNNEHIFFMRWHHTRVKIVGAMEVSC